ncbi:MAG TPA: hypothetical protein VII30_09615 [Gemmatimonadaceae bacterium]
MATGQTATVATVANLLPGGYPCASSRENLDASLKALDARDNDGYREALRDAIFLKPGTKVLLIDIKLMWLDTSHETRSRIRILSGPHQHAACWVDSTDIIKNRPVFVNVVDPR